MWTIPPQPTVQILYTHTLKINGKTQDIHQPTGDKLFKLEIHMAFRDPTLNEGGCFYCQFENVSLNYNRPHVLNLLVHQEFASVGQFRIL